MLQDFLHNPRTNKILTTGLIVSSLATLAVSIYSATSIFGYFQSQMAGVGGTDDFETFLHHSYLIKDKAMLVVVSAVITFTFYMSRRLIKELKEGENFWPESILSTVFYMFCIGIVANLSLTFVRNNDMDIVITDKADVKQVMDVETANFYNKKATALPVFVPTGIFIQSVEFENANDCVMTGVVWQKYDVRDTITSRGFMLPEAQEIEIEELYRRQDSDTIETLGWRFKATIRETFEFAYYPFDYQNLWVRFWHKDFDKNVVLIADLDAYPGYDPKMMPGIEENIVLAGWKLRGAYFGCKYNDYNSNFGVASYVDRLRMPELYYNIFIQRDFMGIFFSQLVPVIMVILLCFITIVLSIKQGTFSETSFFDFNVLDLIGLTAMLLFVVILAHTELRSEFSTDTVFYMEYYYFVLYAAIFVVLLNHILYNHGNDSFFISHRENYIPKILFLPGVALIVFFITVYVFG